ncbi:MAG: fibronectin type III domain-containing protein [Deltaproteobacteria bacterium]|nr:fibronectin type III domain-containing protein [Deltaproteobacteria bacterium]
MPIRSRTSPGIGYIMERGPGTMGVSGILWNGVPGLWEPIDVGNSTSCRLDGLLEGATYYIAVTAYDEYDNESQFSEEVSTDKRSKAFS